VVSSEGPVPGIGPRTINVPARLVSLDGYADIHLDRAVVLVGRHLRCDARLGSLRVSRLHCSVFWQRGEVMVRDLGSTNGTRINGKLTDSGLLRAGDELSIAHLRYRLEADRAPKAAPTPPGAGGFGAG
jgi:pSer/pThr/pTyr-binding forkhead associated (FHA) protein